MRCPGLPRGAGERILARVKGSRRKSWSPNPNRPVQNATEIQPKVHAKRSTIATSRAWIPPDPTIRSMSEVPSPDVPRTSENKSHLRAESHGIRRDAPTTSGRVRTSEERPVPTPFSGGAGARPRLSSGGAIRLVRNTRHRSRSRSEAGRRVRGRGAGRPGPLRRARG